MKYNLMGTKGKIAQAMAIYGLATQVYNQGKAVHSWYVGKHTWVASLTDDSYVYPMVMAWLNTHVDDSREHRFVSTRAKGIERYYDSSGQAEIMVEGHKITVSMEKKENSAKVSDFEEIIMARSSTLYFTSRSEAGIEAVQRLLSNMHDEFSAMERRISLYQLASYGWESQDLPYRNIDSVFLPDGVKDGLLADIEHFFEMESRYRDIGVPWHRGYMLYGPPGNGKTSLVLSIANHLRLGLYSMPLSSINSDNHLRDVISRIGDHSLLLIEDIDVFSSAKDREEGGSKEGGKDSGPTLAGLLNALDGVTTPHGLLTFITTNHEETLDPALVRPGRIDYKVELREPTLYQIENMFQWVYNEDLGVEPRHIGSMAELTNIFKMNMNSPEGARHSISTLDDGEEFHYAGTRLSTVDDDEGMGKSLRRSIPVRG